MNKIFSIGIILLLCFIIFVSGTMIYENALQGSTESATMYSCNNDNSQCINFIIKGQKQ